jgi:hypothetical protein
VEEGECSEELHAIPLLLLALRGKDIDTYSFAYRVLLRMQAMLLSGAVDVACNPITTSENGNSCRDMKQTSPCDFVGRMPSKIHQTMGAVSSASNVI